jgi:predicted GTPase
MTSLVPADERPAIPKRVLILGAAGRDFHNFNVVFRDDPTSIVVGFTASQIPGIAGRRYPSALAGARYPDGIPIDDEAALEALCRARQVDEVVFAYLQRRTARARDASRIARLVRRCRFRVAGAAPHDAASFTPCHRDHSRSHRLR